MRISAARVIVTGPGRNFVTVKIETDQGRSGEGDVTLDGELSMSPISRTILFDA